METLGGINAGGEVGTCEERSLTLVHVILQQKNRENSNCFPSGIGSRLYSIKKLTCTVILTCMENLATDLAETFISELITEHINLKD